MVYYVFKFLSNPVPLQEDKTMYGQVSKLGRLDVDDDYIINI